MQYSQGCQDLSVLLNACKMLLGIQLFTGQSQRPLYKYFELASHGRPRLAPNESIDWNWENWLIVIMVDYSINLLLNFIYNAGLCAAIFLVLWYQTVNRQIWKCEFVYGIMQVYCYSFWYWNYPALIKISWLIRWIINKQADQVDHHFRKRHKARWETSPESCPAACLNFQWCIETANNI